MMNPDSFAGPTIRGSMRGHRFGSTTRYLVLAWGAAVGAGSLSAQAPPVATSREEIYARQQDEKARDTRPPSRDKGEELFLKAEKIFLLDPSGFFPALDSVYQGGGVTLGAGYRRFYGDNTFWQIKGLYSVLNYKLIEGATVSRDRLKGRLTLGARVGWRDATQVAYYGIGQQSKVEDRANFRFQQTYADADAAFRPRRPLVFKGSLAYEYWDTLKGTGGDPSIETRYTSLTAPGLGAKPGYIHTEVSSGIDWRQSPGYTRRGGLYEVTFHDYHNVGNGPYDFQKVVA